MFISIYSPRYSKPIALFDLKKKRFITNPLGLGVLGTLAADLSHHECHGYKASVANLDKLPRNSRGAIITKEFPLKLSLEELQTVLADALKLRPKGLPAGLAKGESAKALRGGLTPENRYQRPKVITDQMLTSAAELRSEGHTWRIVANSLGVGMSAIKWSYQKMLLRGATAATAA
tara:strand:+ start:169 stop:696 length:528 start_codon:yes stop_codon:yes gene_type:complete